MISAKPLAALLTLAASTAIGGDSLVTFPNRVAAGEVTLTSAVLWTRVAVPESLVFEVATDGSFTDIVATADAEVTDPAIPAKVGIADLAPGTRYHYRVRTPSGDEAIGAFRTPHEAGGFSGLRFGVSGDWRGELSPYPSLANAAGRDLDFFVGLGDTIYADYPSDAVRKNQAETIGEFRAKHSEVYSGKLGLNALGDLRSSTGCFAMIDDHEVTDDFAGAAAVESDARFGGDGILINESPLFLTGLQAFEEYNPVHPLRYDSPDDPRTHGRPKLYRTQRYGDDAAIFLLDARTFRDEELGSVGNPLDTAALGRFQALSFDLDPETGDPLPPRSMLGATQLADLKRDLLAAHESGTLWKFVMVPEPIQNLGIGAAQDRFEGYAAERTELLSFIADHKIADVVFIAADIHGTVINDLFYQTGPDAPHVAVPSFEVVTGAVAYDRPFGPTTFEEAAAVDLPVVGNLLTFLLNSVDVTDRETFEALPLAERDAKYAAIMDLLLAAQGLNQTGLGDSLVHAELLEGGYVAAHSYGWTEFEIDEADHSLTVTTYGIEAYAPDEVKPAILDRAPTVMSRFRVNPTGLLPPTLAADLADERLTIRWPESADGFVLQISAALGFAADWKDVTAETSASDGEISVELDPDETSAFFRLIQSD